MSARSIQIPGGRLVTCQPCAYEQYAPTLTPADRLASKHNRAHHKEET